MFKNNDKIEKVTFEKNSQCEEIGNYAFGFDPETVNKEKESELTKIEFPDSLKRIGSLQMLDEVE